MARTGSGWGNFKRGSRVRMLKGLRKGSLLLSYTKRYNARNVVKITMIDRNRGLMHGQYVNPSKTSQRRRADDRVFAIWDFELLSGSTSYYRIRRG